MVIFVPFGLSLRHTRRFGQPKLGAINRNSGGNIFITGRLTEYDKRRNMRDTQRQLNITNNNAKYWPTELMK